MGSKPSFKQERKVFFRQILASEKGTDSSINKKLRRKLPPQGDRGELNRILVRPPGFEPELSDWEPDVLTKLMQKITLQFMKGRGLTSAIQELPLRVCYQFSGYPVGQRSKSILQANQMFL